MPLPDPSRRKGNDLRLCGGTCRPRCDSNRRFQWCAAHNSGPGAKLPSSARVRPCRSGRRNTGRKKSPRHLASTALHPIVHALPCCTRGNRGRDFPKRRPVRRIRFCFWGESDRSVLHPSHRADGHRSTISGHLSFRTRRSVPSRKAIGQGAWAIEIDKPNSVRADSRIPGRSLGQISPAVQELLPAGTRSFRGILKLPIQLPQLYGHKFANLLAAASEVLSDSLHRGAV